MPHTGICTVSARQDDERQEICVAVCGFQVCRYAGLAGLAVLAATTCSHPQLPVGAGGEAMG